MSIIDHRGRLFGRLNIVDALIVAFVIVLVPLSYGTYLLFKPAQPRISSVAPSEITGAERRIGNGSALTAKFKITGSGLTPLLRARIGDQDALGLVFESPNSADVLVGPVPPGKHDLILLDGIQEVARANGAIDIQASTGTPIRLSGWLIGMEKTAAGSLVPNATLPANSPSSFQVVAVGPERPARSRIRFAGGVAENAGNGQIDREVVIVARCDSPPLYEVCSVGGQMISGAGPITIQLPGSYRFELQEVLPTTAPTAALLTMRFNGPGASLVQVGDEDSLLDPRRARVTAIAGKDANGATVTLALGLDDSREGWRYRGRLVRPGGTLAMATARYETIGQVLSLSVGAPSTTTAAR
jgi:hypothetical protein